MAGRVEKPHRPDPLKTSTAPPKSKNKGGRPTKAQAEEKAQAELALQRQSWHNEAKANLPIAREVVAIPFDMLAKRRGAHWKLSDAERDRIAMAAGVLVAKWLPDIAKQYQEELAFGVLLGAAIVARVRADVEKRDAKKPQPRVVQPDGKIHDGLQRAPNHGHAPNGEDDITAAIAESAT